MFDLDSLRDQFFAALDQRRLSDCEALLQSWRAQVTTREDDLWLNYFEAIYLSEQSPPRWDLADQMFEQIVNAEPPVELHARAYLERALIADYQGQYQRAIEYNQRSLAMFEALGDQAYVAQVLINMGIAHTHAFEYKTANQDVLLEALAGHQRALTICQEIGDERRAALAQLESGTVYKALEHWQEALQSYTVATDKFRCLGWQRMLALTLNNIGEVHHHFRQWMQALSCYQEALALLQALPMADPYEEADIQANLCLTHQALGQRDTGFVASDRAIALIEIIRDPLHTETARVGFFGTRLRIYEERLRLELENKRPEQALTILERAKSRTFIELLAERGELRSSDDQRHSSAEQASTHQINPLTAEQILQRLPADTALLEYFLTAQEACVFIATQNHLTITPLAPNLQALLKRQFEWQHQHPVRLTPDRSGRLRQPWSLPILYQLLIEPIHEQIREYRRLCIVPHGSLHYIPFHALISQTTSRPCYFLEGGASTREIIYAPSATVLLDYCRAKPASQGKGGIIYSNSKSLPFVENEGKAILRILGGQLYVNAAATIESVQHNSSDYPILHFACHGSFDAETPLASGLDLFDGRLRADYVLEHLHLQADLVTLSGCETGRSQLYRGDELIGLTRAFIYAGTPSVLVSLWQTDDLATRLFMEKFYLDLVTNLSPPAALHSAQLYLMNISASKVHDLLRADGVTTKQATAEIKHRLAASGFPSNQKAGSQTIFSHPYYWAPFFLVGDRLKD